jgi:peptide/nickel transport system ATP-binding protein
LTGPPLQPSEHPQNGNAGPLLAVEDLRIRFAQQEAVRGISFSIAPGETLGLVGESGSGKSATSLALLRLLPASATVTGRILLAETPQNQAPGGATDLLSLPEEAMRRRRGQALAMIFQEPMTALNPVMSIGRQIGEAVLAHAPRTSRPELRDRVLAALHEVALPDPERRLRDYPHQFSGGQRQRIVIAMALINRPRLVIADEPTTALDVTVQAQILALLQRLRTVHGLSMLFISHDLAVVGQVADRIAVMRHGQILEQGPARDILTRPRQPYTRGLLAAAPTLHTRRDQPLPVLSGVD